MLTRSRRDYVVNGIADHGGAFGNPAESAANRTSGSVATFSASECRPSPAFSRQLLSRLDASWLQRGSWSRWQVALAAIVAAAFCVRVGVRVAVSGDDFWVHGFTTYYALAEHIAAGEGFCLQAVCAWWTPLYPLFLSLTALIGKNYLLIVVPQALIGAGTAFLAFLIGRELFDWRAGLLACAVTAFYPYYVMHDTALQDTGVYTFLVALAVWLLLRARRLDRARDWVVAGAALGAIILTRASAVPTALVAVLWIAAWGATGNVRRRLTTAAVVALVASIVVAPWLITTYRLTGAPILSSQTGRALWIGNNPHTFEFYPERSLDLATRAGYAALAPTDRAELRELGSNEVAVSNWHARRAVAYVLANPGLTLVNAARKVAAGFSWELSPRRDTLVQAAYAIGYVPVSILGAAGLLLARRNRAAWLIDLLFVAFTAVTIVFFAHTSHRVYLDVYLIVFAASAALAIFRVTGIRSSVLGLPPDNHDSFGVSPEARVR